MTDKGMPQHIARADLSTIIDYIRQQLIASDRQRAKAGDAAMFVVKGVEIELRCVLTRSTEDGLKFDLKVVSFGAESAAGAEQTHVIRVSLSALGSDDSFLPLPGQVGILQKKKGD